MCDGECLKLASHSPGWPQYCSISECGPFPLGGPNNLTTTESMVYKLFHFTSVVKLLSSALLMINTVIHCCRHVSVSVMFSKLEKIYHAPISHVAPDRDLKVWRLLLYKQKCNITFTVDVKINNVQIYLITLNLEKLPSFPFL